MTATHPTPADLAAFRDGRLAPGRHAEIDSRLSFCVECWSRFTPSREEFIEELREEIARRFGIPPDLLGRIGASNRDCARRRQSITLDALTNALARTAGMRRVTP